MKIGARYGGFASEEPEDDSPHHDKCSQICRLFPQCSTCPVCGHCPSRGEPPCEHQEAKDKS